MQSKNWTHLFLLATAVAAYTGCQDENGTEPTSPPGRVASILVLPGDAIVLMEAKVTLQVELRDASSQIISGTTVSWSSTDTAVASVSPTGVVTGRSLGTVTIRAVAEQKQDSATVHIVPRIILNPEYPSLFPGDTTRLTVHLETATGTRLPPMAMTWTTAAPGLATVDSDGVVHAVGAGPALIAASAGGGRGEVYVAVIRRPGTTVRRVAWLYEDGVNPIDGSYISELWTANANGSDPLQVSSRGDIVEDFAWSPDGTRMAIRYIARSLNGGPVVSRSALVVVNADGTGEIVLARPGGEHPRWSPDGSQIVYADPFDGGGLRTVNSGGGGRTTLTSNPADASPEWSPDGRRLFFTSANCAGLWTIHPDGTGRRKITSGSLCQAQVSPDGKRIAFIGVPSADTVQAFGVWTMSTWGSDTSQPVSGCGVPVGGWGAVAWLADAHRLWIREPQYGPAVSVSVCDLLTGSSERLVFPTYAERAYLFAPDMGSILYADLPGIHGLRIVRLDLGSGSLTAVSDTSRTADRAVWQPGL